MYWSSLGQPNGHIMFAGEHMITPHGWINSALMSGIQAVNQVLDNVCGKRFVKKKIKRKNHSKG